MQLGQGSDAFRGKIMKSTDLGVGVVWNAELDPICRNEEGLVDVVEVEPETLWIPLRGRGVFRSLVADAVLDLPQPKLLHGVGAPLGGTCEPPPGHIEAFARDVEALRPPYISEHLSITRFRPTPEGQAIFAGFMLPPLQSRAGVACSATNIRQRRAALGNPLMAVETPVSYLSPAPGELTDGEFVAAVATEADCAILLDLHNVLCNSRNGRQSFTAFCDALPLDRVWELHLAGGEKEGRFHLDAHGGLVEPELMALAAMLVPKLPNLRAINLEIMPECVAKVGLHAIGKQLQRMRELWDTRGTAVERVAEIRHTWPAPEPPLNDPTLWENLLGCAITGRRGPAMDDATAEWWRSVAPALDLYRMLVGEGRASAVMSAAPHTTRLLLQECGGPGTREMLVEFWRSWPQGYTATEEAETFLRFLTFTRPEIPGLLDAVTSDETQIFRARP